MPAYLNVEIDPVQAQLARERTGRAVIAGDFLQVELPGDVEAIVGNPPFVASTVAAFLERSHAMLREGGGAVSSCPPTCSRPPAR